MFTSLIFLSTISANPPLSSLIATLKFINSFLVVGANVYFIFALLIITIGTASSKLLCNGKPVNPFSNPTFNISLLSSPWSNVFLTSSPHHSNGYWPPLTWLGLSLFVLSLALIFSGWPLCTGMLLPFGSVHIKLLFFLSTILTTSVSYTHLTLPTTPYV